MRFRSKRFGMHTTNPKIVGGCFIVMGIVFFTISIFFLLDARTKSNWPLAKGQTISYEYLVLQKRDSDSNRTYDVYRYCPLVAFETAKGEQIEVSFDDTIGQECVKTDEDGNKNKSQTETSSSKEFRYNPDSPKDIAPSSDKLLYLFPGVFLATGVILAAIGGVILRFRDKFVNGEWKSKKQWSFQKEIDFNKKDPLE